MSTRQKSYSLTSTYIYSPFLDNEVIDQQTYFDIGSSKLLAKPHNCLLQEKKVINNQKKIVNDPLEMNIKLTSEQLI